MNSNLTSLNLGIAKATNRFAGALYAAAFLLGSLPSLAITLNWDSTPGNAGADDGSGSWGAAGANTNWWNGTANVPWQSGDIAVLGLNRATASTITLTNNIVAGGIVYSNAGAGLYTLGAANNSTLTFAGPAPLIQLSGPTGVHAVSPTLVATGTLHLRALSANTGTWFRAAATSNALSDGVVIGAPGNASYATPTGLFVDFNNGTLANVLRHTTNVTVHSNATLRLSGQNGSAYNLIWPQRITLSGDGQGGTRGAWIITGNAGGTFSADVTLAGDSTILVSSGGGGAYTYMLNGSISGTGSLRLLNDSGYSTLPTVILTGGPHTYTGTQTILGGNLALRLQGGPNRLPTTTALTLGTTVPANGATVAGFGKLILGNATAEVNQTLSGLASDPLVPGCAILGGHANIRSLLAVNVTTDSTCAATLGGTAAPDNQLTFIKAGFAKLTLPGTSQCAGGYSVLAGTLEFGDGLTDRPLTGPIANHATLSFNVATGRTVDDPITGDGSLSKRGPGSLALNQAVSGPITVNEGTLAGSGPLLGPVTVTGGATLSPGDGPGSLTISNSLLLAGTTVMDLDKLAPTNDSVRGLVSVTYGGQLILSNRAGAYTVGDAFQLFEATLYHGAFAAISPVAPGPGRAWDMSTLTKDGTLRVVASTTPNTPPAWDENPLNLPAAAAAATYSESLAAFAADPDAGDTLTFSKLSGAAWLQVAASGVLAGTPGTNDLGTNTFAVRVTDSLGAGADATLRIVVADDPNAPAQIASPDGRLVLTFAVTDFDGSAHCPAYSVTRDGQTIIATSRLGLTFNGAAWREHLSVVGRSFRTRDETWQPVHGERSQVRDHCNELTLTLRETQPPGRVLELAIRAYDTGVAFAYTIPAQPGLSSVSSLTEQSEFRFTGNHTTWSVTSAQGGYSPTTISGLASGNERPLTVQVATNLFLALGEARLVDYARMKFNQLGRPNSLVSALSSPVTSPLPLTTPWRYVMAAESPGSLLQNNTLMLNLNDPCQIADPAWIKPGKVLREVTLNTTGGVACVDFAVKHKLQYIEFDAGWYGPENSTADATRVSVDPARSPGPLDLQHVINYAASNGVGVILYVNKVALQPQIDILPGLFRGWGVKGIKFGFVNVGSQANTAWLHEAIRKCATNQIMVDVHDEYRGTGWERTYPNLMTVEGIRGDEETPPAAQDLRTLFTRMIAGPGDHTVCYFERRVTNNWNHAYQLAKAVIFHSPWQFLYWYDRPPESPIFGGAGGSSSVPVTSDEPELEFYDTLPTTWDDTRVPLGVIGEYAVVARRKGGDWFVGAMNANQARTLELPLDFLEPGRRYQVHRYSHAPSLTTRTRVRIERTEVVAADVLSLPLAATDGLALRITPVAPPGFQQIRRADSGTMSLLATGQVAQPWTWWATPGVAAPSTNWTLMGTGLFTTGSLSLVDFAATNHPQRFYRLSSP
jgi:alpha-glucosidase